MARSQQKSVLKADSVNHVQADQAVADTAETKPQLDPWELVRIFNFTPIPFKGSLTLFCSIEGIQPIQKQH